MMVGTDNMWINAGKQQFHLPRGRPQRFRGVIGLTVPDLEALEARLRRVSPRLDGTQFSWRRNGAQVALTCPWGNRFRAHPAGGAYVGPLGVPYVETPVAKGAAAGIARFYRSAMGAPAEVDGDGVRVTVGPGQRFVFRESDEPEADYDGHHIAIYAADFSGPYRALAERSLVSAEDNPDQYRFIDIVAPKGKEGAVLPRARGAEPVPSAVPPPARQSYRGLGRSTARRPAPGARTGTEDSSAARFAAIFVLP